MRFHTQVDNKSTIQCFPNARETVDRIRKLFHASKRQRIQQRFLSKDELVLQSNDGSTRQQTCYQQENLEEANITIGPMKMWKQRLYPQIAMLGSGDMQVLLETKLGSGAFCDAVKVRILLCLFGDKAYATKLKEKEWR